ncbi:MAG: DUF4202 domain-containing protein [Pseudomonadota bacterium]
MTDRLSAMLAAIDAANALDPTLERDGAAEQPAALLYGQRMSAELDRLAPNAPELLRIAARGQHIERWKMPRTAYPEGRAGYLDWRRAQAVFHGERVGGLMAEAGYAPEDGARVGAMLRKEGIKRDPEVQLLEDVICFVFVRWYLGAFAAKHAEEDVVRIVGKTARKMSGEARRRMLAEFDLAPVMAAAIRP